MSLVVRRLGLCRYPEALALQDEMVTRKLAGDGDDYLLLLEHDPVYTLGRGADVRDLRNADGRLAVPAFRVGRGGGVTFHGPGQLVGYPIIALRRSARDVHRYVRTLEDVLIVVCADFGLRAARRADVTGVWVGGGKIASIGIGVRRWITLHGIALNVSTDLRFFSQIVPCRMPGLTMTSMALELGTPPTMADVEAAFARRFSAAFGFDDPARAEAHFA
jgi:lipoyl(octanoyl) transferase